MAINISSNYYSGYASSRVSNRNASGIFNPNAAYQQSSAMVSQYKDYVESTTELRKDSAEFLKTYTKQMKTMDSAAGALRGSNLDKLIGKASADGKLSEENLKKTTDAVQTMVDTYNTSLKTLNANADRGSGVMRQLGRMASDPAAAASMNLMGVTVAKDGSLKLDAEKLTTALTDAAASDAKTGTSNKMNLMKSVIGGNTGLAAGVQNDAKAGLSTSAGSLISNDLAKLQSQTLDNPINFGSMYTRSGAYNMMNMGVIGILMNRMV